MVRGKDAAQFVDKIYKVIDTMKRCNLFGFVSQRCGTIGTVEMCIILGLYQKGFPYWHNAEMSHPHHEKY